MTWHSILELLVWFVAGLIISMVQNKLGEKIISKSFANKTIAFFGYWLYGMTVFVFTIFFMAACLSLVGWLFHFSGKDLTLWLHSFSENWRMAITALFLLVTSGLSIAYLIWVTMTKKVNVYKDFV